MEGVEAELLSDKIELRCGSVTALVSMLTIESSMWYSGIAIVDYTSNLRELSHNC